MPDLKNLRDEIDETDNEIVRLFEKRMHLVEDVARYKIENGKAVLDRSREQAKLESLMQKADTSFDATCIEELFRLLMALSRKRQYQILTENDIRDTADAEFIQTDRLQFQNARVVFQGVKGAYSFAAMKTFFGDSILSTNVDTWKEAMEMVAVGTADYAVLPIENSTAGIVSDIYDLMLNYPVYIVGEQILRIDHRLLALPGVKPEEIEVVYSHPQALAQCSDYLDEHHPDWKRQQVLNTAMAAEKVAKEGKRSQAAIASSAAGEYFGLEPLTEDRLSRRANSTRFIIISGRKCFLKDAKKVSICFQLPHECGTLYNVLSHIFFNNLNMTKIESRPIPNRNWEYRFFVDFDGNLMDSAVENTLRGIRQETEGLRILGNY